MSLFKRVRCDICDRRFLRDIDLMNHKQIFHESDQKYDCKQCNRYFSSMEEMRAHLQREHSYKS